MDTGVSRAQFYKVSDLSHFGWGMLFVLFFTLFGANPVCIALSVALVFGWKEAFYDPKYEPPVVAGSGMRDWLGYLFGALTGVLVEFTHAWISSHVFPLLHKLFTALISIV